MTLVCLSVRREPEHFACLLYLEAISGTIGERSEAELALNPGPKRTRSIRGIMSPDLYSITAIRPFSPKQNRFSLSWPGCAAC